MVYYIKDYKLQTTNYRRWQSEQPNLEVLCRACTTHTPVCTHTLPKGRYIQQRVYTTHVCMKVYSLPTTLHVLSCIRRPPPLTFNRSIVHCSWTLIFGPFLPHALAEYRCKFERP